MIRTFQPVGHGTFVTEQFEEGQNVVFDCGSTTSLGLVSDLIRTNFRKGEVIDGVFISSLDLEHAGGLEALMNWCRVAKLYIPYLYPEEQAYTLLRYLCEGGQADDFLGRLILDPRNALSAYQLLDRRMPLVTQVAEETAKEKNVFDKCMSMDLMPWKSIEGFRVFVDENFDWAYQVQICRQGANTEKLTSILLAKGLDAGWMRSGETVKRGWRQNPIRKLLKEAYREFAEEICVVSLAVYSGPEILDHPMYEQYSEKGKWCYHARIHSGALFVGDLRLSEEPIRTRLMTQLGRLVPRIGCVLLPGHGSEDMFHEEILPKRNAVAVAVADSENDQCLPHGNVVREIMSRRIALYLVTELPGSTARFAISEEKKRKG